MTKVQQAEQLIQMLLIEDPVERLKALGLDSPSLEEKKVLEWAKVAQQQLRSVPSHPMFSKAWEVSAEIFRSLTLQCRIVKGKG